MYTRRPVHINEGGHKVGQSTAGEWDDRPFVIRQAGAEGDGGGCWEEDA